MRRLIFLAVSLLSAASAAAEDEWWQHPFTVCAILKDHPKNNGKIVAVRGRLQMTDEGTWLAGENCQSSLETKGYNWQMIISLVRSKDPALPGDAVVQRDDKSFQSFYATLKRFPTAKRITVTYRGLLQTYDDLSRRVAPNLGGVMTPLGFGHSGIAPAQLVVQSVSLKDLIIE